MWGTRAWRLASRGAWLAPVGASCAACEVYAFGDNTSGQLGKGGAKRALVPEQVPVPGQVVSLSAGGSCSAAVTSDGRVFSWGLTKDNRLGHSAAFTEKVTSPTLVQPLEGLECVDVACGDAHSVVRTKDGRVYSWGRCINGEAGRGSEDRFVDNASFAAGARPPAGGGAVVGPVELPIAVEHVACGKHHTLACGGGQLLGWGAVSDGQLGPELKARRIDQATPVEIPGLPPVADVACGHAFSAVLTRDGQVWTWGNNTWKQLGHDGGVAPVALDGVEELACGGSHCIARTAKGEVYTWGLNREGQLGHGHKAPSIAVPQRVETIHELGSRAVRVAAGDGHSLVVLADGRVLLFGRGRDGQLGLEGLVSSSETRVSPAEAAFFRSNGRKVTAVALGGSHSLVGTD